VVQRYAPDINRRMRPHLKVSGASFDCKLRRVKYLNNMIEQDHRIIRRRWREAQCFHSFHTAERTLESVEAVHMIRKGQA
jgi:transposase-like protein